MVNQASDWQNFALCLKPNTKPLWVSSDYDEIREAAMICQKCAVKIECLENAVYNDEFVGVRGGVTEYEYLSRTWVRVDNAEESNWPRTDSIIHRLLREYK
jgi:hypothetical protein